MLVPLDPKILNYNSQLTIFHKHKWAMVSFCSTFVVFLAIEMCSIFQEDHEGQKPPKLHTTISGDKPDYNNPSWDFLFPIRDYCTGVIPLLTCVLCIVTLAICVLCARRRAKPFTKWMVSHYYDMSYWYAIVGNFLITAGLVKTLCDRHSIFKRWQKSGFGYNHFLWFLGVVACLMLPILTVCKNDFVPNDEVTKWSLVTTWGQRGPAVVPSCKTGKCKNPEDKPEFYYLRDSKTHQIHTVTAVLFFCGCQFYQILHTCAFAYNVMMKGYYTGRTISFLVVWVTVNLSTLVFLWLTVYNQIQNHSGYAVWEWASGMSLYAYWLPYSLIIYLGNTPGDEETDGHEGSPDIVVLQKSRQVLD